MIHSGFWVRAHLIRDLDIVALYIYVCLMLYSGVCILGFGLIDGTGTSVYLRRDVGGLMVLVLVLAI